MDQLLTNFIRALRNADVRISTAETLDAFATVELVGYRDRQLLKDSLALALPKTLDEKAAFDTCFDQFFSFRERGSLRASNEAQAGDEASASDGAGGQPGSGGDGNGESQGNRTGRGEPTTDIVAADGVERTSIPVDSIEISAPRSAL